MDNPHNLTPDDLQKIEKLEEQIKDLGQQRGVLSRKIGLLNRKIEKIRSDSIDKEISKGINPELFMRPGLFHGVSQSTYEKLTGWFTSNYSRKGLIFSGSGLEQPILCLAFNKKRPLAEQCGIRDFYQYLVPVTIDDLTKEKKYLINILEYTCSYYGTYDIYREPDSNEWVVCKKTYGQTDELFKSNIMMKIMKYVYDRLPYEGVEENEFYDD